ncbi:response regulator [Myxococcota bacterium]
MSSVSEFVEEPRFSADFMPDFLQPMGELRRATIVIAEDDPAMRRLLMVALHKEGYRVVEAKDGTELQDALQEGGDTSEIDLVISDIQMPGRSGMEVLDELRKTDWVTPMILITAFGDEETHLDAHLLGAATILDKPFDLEDLRFAVHSIIPRSVM